MPETLTHTVEQLESPAEPAQRPRWLVRLALALLLAFLAVSLLNEGVTLFIRHSWLRESIARHLSSAFGRPVEVGNLSFSIWSGPEVTAESVLVAEDPRFGNEYFLRADSLRVRLLWGGIMSGHLVLGRVLLEHPSLNLVRNDAGDWNFAEWLPRPASLAPGNGFAGPVRRTVPGFVLNRIEVDAGRINFKIEDKKLPFALVDVTGSVDPETPSRWHIDLEAEPLRATVVLQRPGTLRVVGEVGGTSSRLRPANLQFYWTDASVSDLLRLALEQDAGIRGLLNMEIDAGTREDSWQLIGRASLSGLHRWDLAARSDNPSAVVTAKAALDPAKSTLEVTNGAIDAPHSHLSFATQIDWSGSAGLASRSRTIAKTHLDSDGVALNDLLAWLRAFRADVANDIAVGGDARVRWDSNSWPPRLNRASVSWDRAVVTGPRLRSPVRLSAGTLETGDGHWSLAPVALSFGDSSGSLRLESTARVGARGPAQWQLAGQLEHARDLISIAAAFGWNLSRGWDLEGPLRCDLRWPASDQPWLEPPQGTVDWGNAADGASLQTPFLNQPVREIRAHAEWKPGAHSIALVGADAFGAHWNGTFERRDDWPEWQFDLAADHLAAADLDRWLDPRWKQTFLARLLPFLNPRSPANAMPENLGATGTISVGQVTLPAAILRKLQGNLSLQGRTVELSGAHAQMFGGAVSGSFLADLHATPGYVADFNLLRVDLGQWEAATSTEPRPVEFSGQVSGETTIRAMGTDRASLASSLACEGTWDIQNPEIRGINLGESLAAGAVTPGASAFREGAAKFTCAGGRIRIAFLKLAGTNQDYDIAGSLDFSRNANLRVTVEPSSKLPNVLSESAEGSQAAGRTFILTGNLSSPELRAAAPASPLK